MFPSISSPSLSPLSFPSPSSELREPKISPKVRHLAQGGRLCKITDVYPQIRSQQRGDRKGEGGRDKEEKGREDNREERERKIHIWPENMENGVLGLVEIERNKGTRVTRI